jgi:hypothetical protein
MLQLIAHHHSQEKKDISSELNLPVSNMLLKSAQRVFLKLMKKLEPKNTQKNLQFQELKN